MAQKTNKVSSTPTQTNQTHTVEEIKNYSQKQQHRQELFEKAQAAMKLLDLTKKQSRNYTIFNKEKLRSYMKNPMSNEANIRNLSKFLYRVSMPYKRLVWHNAQQVDLTAMIISPNIDITKSVNSNKILKEYYATCVQVDKIHLHTEIYKMLLTAWIEDTSYGYIYEDDTGFFIYPLDGQYCKVSSQNMDGSLNFAYDFNYFKSHAEDLEYWDPEFKKKNNAFTGDTSLRWQELDPNRTICLKVGIEDPLLSLPPYLPLFENIIDAVDVLSLVSVKDELSIYKLLVARLNHMSGSEDPSDFEVDIDTALEYFYKLQDSLPESVSAAISPLPIDTIEFKGTSTDDSDMVAKSMSNLFKISGGSMILNDEKSGSTIFRFHAISDMMQALKPLLGEIEVWINRYLRTILSNPSIVKYIETSPYMKSEKKKELIESAQYGIPCKMAVAALDGFSPLEVLRMQVLEVDTLALHNSWIPLKSSYTQSGDNDSNKKDINDLTDDGAETREEDKNDM